MQQIYYTQEGTAYVLRTASTMSDVSIPVDSEGAIIVAINNTGEDIMPGYDNSIIEVITSKKIIPVGAYLSWATASATIVDISAFFYLMMEGKTAPFNNSNIHWSAMGKMMPLLEKNDIGITNPNSYHYNVRYGQAVFNDNDFIDPSIGLSLIYCEVQSGMLTQGASSSDITFNLPADDYTYGLIFTYFEML
jgi:hypothetical protein